MERNTMGFIASRVANITTDTRNHEAPRAARPVCLAQTAAALIVITTFIFAPYSASAISPEELSAISSNCSTIRQSLRQLQKSDSKTRTYLGTAYETVANKFITPLNLRLVRNNRPTLSELQTNFIGEQAKFRDGYTDYMRELEGLIAIDCQVEPERFYTQLTVVRERRAKVHLAAEALNKLASEQYQSVMKLKQELKP